MEKGGSTVAPSTENLGHGQLVRQMGMLRCVFAVFGSKFSIKMTWNVPEVNGSVKPTIFQVERLYQDYKFLSGPRPSESAYVNYFFYIKAKQPLAHRHREPTLSASLQPKWPDWFPHQRPMLLRFPMP